MSENLENPAVATGLEMVSFHSNYKECNAKECFNYCTIALISHARKYSKSFTQGFSSIWTKNFQRYNLGFEESEEAETKLLTSVESQRKQRNSRKTCTSASLTRLKSLTVWITSCGKFLRWWEYHTTLPDSWEIYRWVKKEQLV